MTAISIERNTEKFNNLPLDYQEAIKTSDYDNSLALVTTEHKLHIDQSSTLEVLLAKLIFGEIESKDIVSKIETGLNITNPEAVHLANQLNELIIKPIKENLKNIQMGGERKGDIE
jgi:hypothetical protein